MSAPVLPGVGSPAEIGRLLAHLEQRLEELDRLHREIAEDVQALAHAAAATPEGRDACSAFVLFLVHAPRPGDEQHAPG